MKRNFKVGDRVKDSSFGIGTVVHDDGSDWIPYAVEFDNEMGSTADSFKCGHSLWTDEKYLTLINEPETPNPCATS